MDVLYVGPYRQSDGWGNTSKNFVDLLIKQDINLILRPVWFNNEFNKEPVPYQSYEFKKSKTNDIVIQHGLPNFLNYNGKFKKNVAVTKIDCNVDNTDWIKHLNLFDQVIVFSDYEKEMLKKVKTKVTNFNFPPYIPDKINYKNLNLNLQGKKFYTFFSNDNKSGFMELITAYLSSFDCGDNVQLFIIQEDNSSDPENLINEIKSQLGIFNSQNLYPKISILKNSSFDSIKYLHTHCDFYINISYNMTPDLNILNAIVHGSIPIVLDTCDLMFKLGTYPHKFIVCSNDEIMINKNRPLPNLYCGKFYWKIPSTSSLRNNLLRAYTLTEEQLKKEKFKMTEFGSKIESIQEKSIKDILCLQ